MSREKYFQLAQDRFTDLRQDRSAGRRTFQVGKIWERQREIIRLLALGYKNVEIADMLGCSPVTISYTRNSPVVEERLEQMNAARDMSTIDIARDIKMKAPKALKVLENVLDGREGTLGELASPALRVKTAENWLDRAGYPAQKSSQSMHFHAHLTSEDIDDIKRRAKAGGVTIDAQNLANT